MGSTVIKEWLDALLGMIYPNVCEICGTSLVNGEKIICSHCNIAMPRTGIHNDRFNHIHQRLFCHAPILNAGAMFYYYKNDSYARLIHKLKYNNRREIGRELGRMYARELAADSFFSGIDILIPVPVHWSKLISRGYNQAAIIAEGISDVTSIPVGDHLKAVKRHPTQTRRGALARWENSEGIYRACHSDELVDRHVLIIDDVVTTGATLIHCCEAIHAASPSTTISVLTLGATKLT